MINLKRLRKSFTYAIKGLKKTFQEEQNLRIQTAAGIAVLLLAWLLGLERLEVVMLVFAISLVILMEIANSAVERITDILKPRLNVYVEEIKDITAAAVFLSSMTAVIIGAIIFWPYLF